MCTSVVGRSNGPEALLSGCVPNLKLHSLAVELDGADFKVHADGGDVALGVGVIGKSEQQTRLSNTRISDKEELEEIVVFRGDHGCGWVLLRARKGLLGGGASGDGEEVCEEGGDHGGLVLLAC